MIRRLLGAVVLALLGILNLGCAIGRLPPEVGRDAIAMPVPVPPQAPYQNPDLPLDTRVDDLIRRMTLEEKVSQTLFDAVAIQRLYIPEYNWWNEALHGVARAGVATVFPQAIGLAATFDPFLMYQVAEVISDEARAKHHEAVRLGWRGIYQGLTFWSPNINIFRDPRWGRGMETFGEDPYLTGRMAAQFVRGMQGTHPYYLKTVATPKHYAVHSGPEPDRHSFDAVVDERDLRETYLPAFRTSIVEGHAESVMCAYNRFRGDPACGSEELLGQILRDEWGFSGYVVSDCGAIYDIYEGHDVVETPEEAAAMGVSSGTDLNCGDTYNSLVSAVRDDLLSEEQLEESLKRLFRARFRLGAFDPPERVPYADIPYSVNDSEEHKALALEATRKSIVLLKNQGGLLPLRKDLETIAVIGPNADEVDVLLGNYNGIPSDPVTPLRGIREKVEPQMEVLFARGSRLAESLPKLEPVPLEVLRTPVLRAAAAGDGAQGLRGEYYDNRNFEGRIHATVIDRKASFSWFGEEPLEGLEPGNYSVRWSGSIIPPVTGLYELGTRALGSVELYVDDSLVARSGSQHEVNTSWSELYLAAGVPRDIRMEYRSRRPDAVVELVWSEPEPDLVPLAVETADSADAVVLVLGLSPRLEGEEMRVEVPGFEGGDRVDMGFPAAQQELLEAVVATGKPVVLVLLNGSALAIPWAAENVDAIVEAWYPGQAAGTAIADVVFGDYNPAGRLPVTFYRSVDQLPPFSDYDMEGRTYRYFRGDPLFPFGHGLSYTTFAYRNLVLPDSVVAGEEVPVSVEVRNTGAVPGEEVVQLYVTDVDASAPVPIRSLAGTQRIFLSPGAARTVNFTLTPRQLSLIDTEWQRVLEPGAFEVSVGGKQPGFTGLADAGTTGVVMARFRVVGEALRLAR